MRSRFMMAPATVSFATIGLPITSLRRRTPGNALRPGSRNTCRASVQENRGQTHASAAPRCGVGWRQWFAEHFSYLIKEFGREIRVIWPHNSVYVVIDFELSEIGQVLQRFKNGTVQMVRKVNDSDFFILKSNLQFIPADIRSVYDVMHTVPLKQGVQSRGDLPSVRLASSSPGVLPCAETPIQVRVTRLEEGVSPQSTSGH